MRSYVRNSEKADVEGQEPARHERASYERCNSSTRLYTELTL